MPSFYNKENVLQQYEYHSMQYRKICMKALVTGVFNTSSSTIYSFRKWQLQLWWLNKFSWTECSLSPKWWCRRKIKPTSLCGVACDTCIYEKQDIVVYVFFWQLNATWRIVMITYVLSTLSHMEKNSFPTFRCIFYLRLATSYQCSSAREIPKRREQWWRHRGRYVEPANPESVGANASAGACVSHGRPERE